MEAKLSDPKETPSQVENETAAVEEQTADPFAVEDEADIEAALEDADLDEEDSDEEAEAAEGEDDEEAESDEDEDLEDDVEFDEDGNPVEDAC